MVVLFTFGGILLIAAIVSTIRYVRKIFAELDEIDNNGIYDYDQI